MALDEVIKVLGVYEIRVVFINVSKEEIVNRIATRGQNRTDDKPEIAAERYVEYEKRNQPIKEYYQKKGILTEINGEQTVDNVHHEIAVKLGLEI